MSHRRSDERARERDRAARAWVLTLAPLAAPWVWATCEAGHVLRLWAQDDEGEPDDDGDQVLDACDECGEAVLVTVHRRTGRSA